ncbi:hypothetical protein [Gluconobacter sp. Dm-44]|uniref:hypothetical protein n=1 Tax=Gluconobacter sp. Dm-44 TaxID=2799805 RepID=UPI001B8B970D|nr:hypothetical protein [Gluconobacter sp. Dm-44]MBS1060469.1 hypothetical protein [Gluconobacter sp. Dm-44]
MTDGPGVGDLFVRRLLNLPGQSCGPSGEARSTTAASHPAFSLTVAVPVRKATARPRIRRKPAPLLGTLRA